MSVLLYPVYFALPCLFLLSPVYFALPCLILLYPVYFALPCLCCFTLSVLLYPCMQSLMHEHVLASCCHQGWLPKCSTWPKVYVV